MKIYRRISVLLFFTSLLSSCLVPLPRQMTRHIYTMPASADGKMCFNQCLSKRTMCLSEAKHYLDPQDSFSCVNTSLERSGNKFYESPVNSAYWSGVKSPANCARYTPETSCGELSASTHEYNANSSCDNIFARCVSQCGGSSIAETKTICWGGVE